MSIRDGLALLLQLDSTTTHQDLTRTTPHHPLTTPYRLTPKYSTYMDNIA